MPPATSRATRHARQSASTARAAFGPEPAKAAHFGFGHRIDAEQGIGKSLAQPDFEPAFLRARERREIEVECLG
jgi:hypothetical protein